MSNFRQHEKIGNKIFFLIDVCKNIIKKELHIMT